MANVCVITGGGSGMGLETARNIPKDSRAVSFREESGHDQDRDPCGRIVPDHG